LSEEEILTGAEGDYRCCICGDPVPEDWSDFCLDCTHIPGRRVVWGKLNEEEKQKWWNKEMGGEYGWTYTWKNWTWVPIGDGSGLGVIVRKPATEEKIQAAIANSNEETTR
jgi:hypothetical protein